MKSSSLSRDSEWFVPKFGSEKFRSSVGLFFLPYTGMVLAFSVIGSMLARHIHWDRVCAIVLIYCLGLGIGAHTLDALGSKGIKPWGTVFTRSQLWLLALISLTAAYAIATYYMLRFVPFLWPIALSEGFFVFAYNLELFRGRFHSDKWFALSWGALPVLAGYTMQTNAVSVEAAAVAAAMAFFSLVEIKASRPYKALRRRLTDLTEEEGVLMMTYETILKSVSIGTMLLGGGLLLWRMTG
jgi:hypothetical protein